MLADVRHFVCLTRRSYRRVVTHALGLSLALAMALQTPTEAENAPDPALDSIPLAPADDRNRDLSKSVALFGQGRLLYQRGDTTGALRAYQRARCSI